MELVEAVKKGDTKTFTDYKLDGSTNGQGAGLADVARGLWATGSRSRKVRSRTTNKRRHPHGTFTIRPSDNKKGPIETALIGTPVADAKKPLEV